MDSVGEIKQRLDIVELVSEYLPLKRAGSNFSGLCPFHHEKSPSFMVSNEKQIFHCFGCGEGGDLFTFLMKVEGVEFIEALKLLATKAGVELKSFDSARENKKARLYEICEKACLFYQQKLKEQNESGIAKAYIKERKITSEAVAAFAIGYCPVGWGELRDHLRKLGFADTESEAAGFLVKSSKTGDYYDRFRNRLMFPIYNAFGNVIGFSARVLDVENDKMGKYINSPQTDIYNKSQVLYGLYQAKEPLKNQKKAIFVEGQIDVISSWQCGVKNVVATSGTALTAEHLKLIKRYADEIILCFDRDKAGQVALLRASKLVLPSELKAKVMVPFGGKDPDELIKEDPELYHLSLQESSPLLDYYVKTVVDKLDQKDPRAKEKAIGFLLKLLKLEHSAVVKEHYIKEISGKLNVSEEVLNEEMKGLFRTQKKTFHQNKEEESSSEPAPVGFSRWDELMQRCLALLLLKSDLWKKIPVGFEDLFESHPKAIFLYKVFLVYYSEDNSMKGLNASLVLEEMKTKGEDIRYGRQVFFFSEGTYARVSDYELEVEFQSVLRELRKKFLSQKIDSLSQRLKEAENSKDQEKIEGILKETAQYSIQLSQL